MIKQVLVPDIGAFSNVDIIEILVHLGDVIAVDASLVTLETDKATLEIPSPYAGTVKSIEVKVGSKVSEGSLILTMEVAGEDKTSQDIQGKEGTKEQKSQEEKLGAEKVVSQTSKESVAQKTSEEQATKPSSSSQSSQKEVAETSQYVHAGPGVRRFARELGVDLSKLSGSGPKNRILQKDVQAYVKQIVTNTQSMPAGAQAGGAIGLGGLSIAPWPKVDYAKFGPIKIEPVSRIKKLSGSYLHRNWVMVPHVTQFDEADITELERFRKENQSLAEQQGVKLTPLVFIMKAVVSALKSFPNFNASLDESGSQLILKQYFHIGVAVDTPNGLVVPVVRDVDQKGLFQLAKELGEISQKARAGQLTAQDMQGSSFSISSLGGIGGTAFTPIINVPDVAILGLSRSQIKPVFIEGEFKPCLMLPLSLSYDHRVIDGAEGVRFTTFLVKQLSDIRRLLL